MSDFDSHFNSASYEHSITKARKRGRLNSVKRYKKHLIFLSDTVGGYPSGAYYKTPWRDSTYKARYVRCYRGKGSKRIKRYCNKKLRRDKLKYLNLKRGIYRKATEFWFEYC